MFRRYFARSIFAVCAIAAVIPGALAEERFVIEGVISGVDPPAATRFDSQGQVAEAYTNLQRSPAFHSLRFYFADFAPVRLHFIVTCYYLSYEPGMKTVTVDNGGVCIEHEKSAYIAAVSLRLGGTDAAHWNLQLECRVAGPNVGAYLYKGPKGDGDHRFGQGQFCGYHPGSGEHRWISYLRVSLFR